MAREEMANFFHFILGLGNDTVNSEIFARILCLQIVLKNMFALLKIRN